MKVFRINDYEWYMANTLEEAIKLAMDLTGLPADEAAEDDAHEECEAEMNRMKFVDDDGVTRRTFAAELQRRIEAGLPTGPFASTEY